jgi:hypothetical protein
MKKNSFITLTLFSFITEVSKKSDRVFVGGNLFLPSLILESEAEPNFVEHLTVSPRRYLHADNRFGCKDSIRQTLYLSSSDVCDNETDFYDNETRVEQQYNHTSDNERPTIPKNMQGIQG